MSGHGDLNNIHVMRETSTLVANQAFSHVSLAIPESEDDSTVRSQYRPFLNITSRDHENAKVYGKDWVEELELGTVLEMVQNEIIDKNQDRLRILVLYGSLRSR